MKRFLTTLAGMLAMATTVVHGQGTVYASNVEQMPTGSAPVASDSWLAQLFRTGDDLGGYRLNSVRLLMDGTSGTPEGFELSIYSSSSLTPAVSLGRLAGPDPVTPGTWAFDGADVALSPSSWYFAVVTAATPASQGAFSWSQTGSGSPVSGWAISDIRRYSSADGLDWSFIGRNEVFQLEITATAVPEPSSPALLALGLGGFAVQRRMRASKRKRFGRG